MNWIDCRCMIGMENAPQPFGLRGTQAIREELQRVGISEAFAYHAHARDYHPMEGNLRLMEELSATAETFFRPIWVALPPHTGEFPEPEALAPLLAKHRVAGLRVFPSVPLHNFSLSEWSMGSLYKLLEELQLPLFLDLEHTSWDELDRMLEAHPALLVVVTAGYRQARSFYPLLHKHPGLHIELSMYKNFLGTEELVARFGARRFLYGSGLPLYSAGPCKTMLELAAIGPEALEALASGNARRLVEGIRYG